MNQIHEDDWSEGSWSRHSGMNIGESEDAASEEKEKPTVFPNTIIVPAALRKNL